MLIHVHEVVPSLRDLHHWNVHESSKIMPWSDPKLRGSDQRKQNCYMSGNLVSSTQAVLVEELREMWVLRYNDESSTMVQS